MKPTSVAALPTHKKAGRVRGARIKISKTRNKIRYEIGTKNKFTTGIVVNTKHSKHLNEFTYEFDKTDNEPSYEIHE